MTGETSKSRVRRALDFALKKNSIPVHSAQVDIYKTAMFTTLGECAYFQHDCPDFGSMGDNVQITGRVIAASSSTVTIDGKFKKNMAGGTTYDIMFVTKDNTILTREITSVTESGDYSIVEFTPAITADDKVTKDDVWAVGVQDVVAKLFDIVEIEVSDDLYCTLKLVEYDDDIYELETAYEEATWFAILYLRFMIVSPFHGKGFEQIGLTFYKSIFNTTFNFSDKYLVFDRITSFYYKSPINHVTDLDFLVDEIMIYAYYIISSDKS